MPVRRVLPLPTARQAVPYSAMLSDPLPLAEVIAANTTGFTAQCIELPRPDVLTGIPDPPPLGAWVRVGSARAAGRQDVVSDDDIDPFETPTPKAIAPNVPLLLYGVVCYAEVGATETGRTLTAFGLGEDELRRAQPHLYELLATRFEARLVAHAAAPVVSELPTSTSIVSYLPPRPPRPHAQVWAVSGEETRRLTAQSGFLRALLTENGAANRCPTDELIAAVVRNARRAWDEAGQGEAFLLQVGRELATLLARDYDRLRALLERIV